MNVADPAFVVMALPRSRTKWLAGFLSYGDWLCGHDPNSATCATLDDVSTWFTQPHIGTVETAAAPFWRLLVRLQPAARIVTVRRPVADVLASLARQGIANDTTTGLIKAADRKLDQIEHRVPGVLSVRYADLAREATCAKVFMHCLPYAHVPSHWRKWNGRNVSGDLARQVRYATAYLPRFDKLARTARQRMLANLDTAE